MSFSGKPVTVQRTSLLSDISRINFQEETRQFTVGPFRLNYAAGFVIVGPALLGVVSWKIGFQNILDHLSLIGWSFLPVICISALWKANNTLAFFLVFPSREGLSYWRLFVVNLAGDVVNSSLPLANLGGELAKPILLRSELPFSISMSAVVANKTVEILSGLIFTLICVCLSFVFVDLQGHIRMAIVTATLIGSLAIFLLCRVQRQGLFSIILGMLQYIPFMGSVLRSNKDILIRADRSLMDLYAHSKVRCLAAFVSRSISWLLGIVETYLILNLMQLDPTLLQASLLVALPLMMDTALFFVPAGIGTMETGHSYVSYLLGLSAGAGLSLGLLKRVRRLFWMGLGIALLSARVLQYRTSPIEPE